MKWICFFAVILAGCLCSSQIKSDSSSSDCCYMYIPNVSSVDCEWPDDSYTFQIFSNCEMIEFELTIYNRWGEIMFESNDINATWYAGDYGTDTYFYKLCGTSTCGQNFEGTGSFTVLK